MTPVRSRFRELSARPDERPDQQPELNPHPYSPEITDLHFWTAMEMIPGFAWSALPDGSVEFCNQRWLDYTGLTLDAFRRAGLTIAINPADKSDFEETWRTALAHGTSFEAELRMRRADGSYSWFVMRAEGRRGLGGKVIRWYGINTEIEQRKKAPGEKQKPAFRLDDLFEQAPEAAAILRRDGRIVRVNKEFTRMFGYETGEILHRHLDELIVPAALIESALDYAKGLRQGGRVEVETVRTRKDGSEVRVSILAVPVAAASGEHIATYAIYRDITEQKRAEERLRESEARFQEMADTAPVLIWMTGTDGLCNYFNKPWLDFTGRSMEQEVGTGWLEGVYPDDVQGCFDGFLPAFNARKPFRIEYRLRRADGEYRWLIESGIPRYTGSGEFAGYIGSNIDITDLKRAQEERERLRQLEADLAHANRVSSMGELTASLAHELSQPIAAAIIDATNCLRLLSREQPACGEAREAASRVVEDGMRADEIVRGVRQLFKKDTPQRESLDLNEVIRETILLLHSEATQHGVRLCTEFTEDLPQVMGYRVQLQQMLVNLMKNGIDAMEDVEGMRELTIQSQRDEKGEVLISVSDTGVGLPPQKAEKIFDAFFTTKPSGTGIGLRISRTIVESHGGRLWAAENSPRGAIFYFSLPPGAARD
jgi:PAS domain S-box-containing protein